MMRLSPRLICFIGASSVLLRSALASRQNEEKGPDPSQMQHHDTFNGRVQKLINSFGGTKMSSPNEISIGDLTIVMNKNGQRILKYGSLKHICNITNIEFNNKVLVVYGTKCRHNQNSKELEFETFNSKIEFPIYKDFMHFFRDSTCFATLKDELISARTFDIGKFKMIKIGDDVNFQYASFQRQDGDGTYDLASKPGFFGKISFTLGKNIDHVFKKGVMTLCRNEEGKPVAMWDVSECNTKCQWIELVNFDFQRYLDKKKKVIDHPKSKNVKSYYAKDQDATKMLWDTELIIKGIARNVALTADPEKTTTYTKERHGFLHFVLGERMRDIRTFTKYIETTGITETCPIRYHLGANRLEADAYEGDEQFLFEVFLAPHDESVIRNRREQAKLAAENKIHQQRLLQEQERIAKEDAKQAELARIEQEKENERARIEQEKKDKIERAEKERLAKIAKKKAEEDAAANAVADRKAAIMKKLIKSGAVLAV